MVLQIVVNDIVYNHRVHHIYLNQFEQLSSYQEL